MFLRDKLPDIATKDNFLTLLRQAKFFSIFPPMEDLLGVNGFRFCIDAVSDERAG